MPGAAFRVMARRCDQCLLDPENRIVSASRAAEIIRQTKDEDCKFICHKASIAGMPDVACRGHHDAMPCRAARFAAHVGIPIIEIDPETMKETAMNTTTTERPKGGTNKTKADAIRAARAALGDDSIEGLDFVVRNTGAGWAFAEIGDGTPQAPEPAAGDALAHVTREEFQPPTAPQADPGGAVKAATAKSSQDDAVRAKAATRKATSPKKAKANVEAPVKPQTKTGGAGSKPPRKPPAPPATAPKAAAPKKERKPRAGKTATLIGLLRRPEGATMPELIAASSWAENSLKWFMKGTLGKKDLTVTSTTAGDPPVTTYQINEEAI